jgi:hypothetical protein
MKTTLSVVLALALAVSPALAQNQRGGNGGGGGGGRGAGGNSGGGNQGGDSSDGSQQQSSGDNGQYSPAAIAERLINSDNWNLDSENGVFQWKNSKFDIGNNLIVRSRFERYLETPGDADNTAQYQQILEKVKVLLTPKSDGSNPGPEDIAQAYDLMSQAAQFPEDGGASDTLLQLVADTWRIRAEVKQNEQDHNDLEGQRLDQQQTVASQVTATSDDVNLALNGQDNSGNVAPNSNAGRAGRQQGGGGGGGNNNPTTVGGNAGTGGAGVTANTTTGGGNSSALPSLPTMPGMPAGMPNVPNLAHANEATFDALELARTYAKEGLLEAQTEGAGLRSKLQFQTQIIAFMMQRRFQHSLIAGQFYDQLFKGSEQGMDAMKAQLSKFMDVRDILPTVNSLQFISHEAIADTDTGMKAVDASYDNGERWASLQLLQETFLLGEMLPSVQEFDPAKRKVLSQLYREANDLKHMMDLHDYAAAETTLTQIEADASDFPAGPVLSAIREAEQTSDLALLSAKQALLTSDSDDAKDSLEKAIEIWPMNPRIKQLQEDVASRLDVMDQMTPQFDDLLKEQAYRQIYDKRSDFGMAFINDPDRAAKLRDVVERIGKIDMLVAYANEAVAQNQGCAAWETLANAAKLDADDPVLTKTQAQVAPLVASFVSALDAAQRAESNGQYATSLNDYLAAQDIYPTSQLCRLGIDDDSKQIMAKLNPDGPSAKALAAEAAAEAAAAAPPAPAAAATPAAQNATQDSTSTSTDNSNGPTASTSSDSSSTPTPPVVNTAPVQVPATGTPLPRTLF